MEPNLKLVQIEEMRNVTKLVELNIELSDILHSRLEIMIRESERLVIRFPNLERTIHLMQKEKVFVESISELNFSPEMKRPDDTPDKETEPEKMSSMIR